MAAWLGFQSTSGLVALVFFGAAAFFWHAASSTDRVTAAPVAVGSAVPSSAGAILIEGQWTRLNVRSAKATLDLPPPAGSASGAYVIERQ
jgi:hypothetical protein